LKTDDTAAQYLGAQRYLKEAVRLDPKFALAWALLSRTDASGYRKRLLQPTDALREEARQAAETALSLQPNLGEALMAKGFYHYACLKDYDTATRYLEEARHLLPNNSQVPESLAYVTRRRGQWDRSEAYFHEAERLNARDPNLLIEHADSYIYLRRFPEALRKLDEALNITPDDFGILEMQAVIAQAQGDLPRAAALLRPPQSNTNDSRSLLTQVYQAILERNPAQIIPRIKQELAKADPASDFHAGDLRFWLGWTQELAGDHAAAQENWRLARSELEAFLEEQPGNVFIIVHLALTDMGLGDKAAAFALLERAMASMPLEKDVLDGALLIETFAQVAARMGEPDRAIAALRKAIAIPSPNLPPFTPAILRLDPVFDPLRGDPRFQELCKEKQP
jgi:tetratricopeptide (TPR) repeat protein